MDFARDLGIALHHARARTDELFELVRPDAIYDRPIAERHRILFYLGHVEAFDWNLICGQREDIRSFHPEFDRLFAFGIDPPPGQLPSDEPRDWPAVPEVENYNRRTRAGIDAVLAELPEQLLHVAIEHRLMHAETLSYILHNLPYERKLAPRDAQPQPQARGAVRPRMVHFAAGKAQLGLPRGQAFGWDNEFEAHCIDVPAFSMGKYKVTNGEYLEFVRQVLAVGGLLYLPMGDVLCVAPGLVCAQPKACPRGSPRLSFPAIKGPSAAEGTSLVARVGHRAAPVFFSYGRLCRNVEQRLGVRRPEYSMATCCDLFRQFPPNTASIPARVRRL